MTVKDLLEKKGYLDQAISYVTIRVDIRIVSAEDKYGHTVSSLREVVDSLDSEVTDFSVDNTGTITIYTKLQKAPKRRPARI